jgi:hypothetical protein
MKTYLNSPITVFFALLIGNHWEVGGRNIFQSMYTYQSPAALRLRFPTLIHCSLCPPKSFPNSLTLSAQILAEDCKYPCVPLYLWARISLWFPHRPVDLYPPPLPTHPSLKTKLWSGMVSVVPLVLSSSLSSLSLCSSQWYHWFCPVTSSPSGSVQQQMSVRHCLAACCSMDPLAPGSVQQSSVQQPVVLQFLSRSQWSIWFCLAANCPSGSVQQPVVPLFQSSSQ